MIIAHDFQFVQGGQRKYSCQIDGGEFPSRLYFEGCANVLPHAVSPSGNFALASLLYPAMVLGEDLEIDAGVSPLLLYSVQHDLQSLLIDYRPELKRIKVSATSKTSALQSVQKEVATGFSAGVDTFTTLALFTAEDVPDSRRITSLTTFDVGAMGPPESSSEIYEKYCERLRDYAIDNSLNWQAAQSNLDQFFKNVGHHFQLNHVIRNVAAALVFEDIIGCYLYSSAYPYRSINKNNDDMSFIEPMLLPLLSTETLRLESAGAGLARYEKSEIVSTYAPAMRMLDVCVGSPHDRLRAGRYNCSKCWKCSRMMLNLDVLGRLENFDEVFDLEYYRRNKDGVILTVLESALLGKPADRDLVDLMRQRNFEFDISQSKLLLLRLKHLFLGIRLRLSRVPAFRLLYNTLRARR